MNQEIELYNRLENPSVLHAVISLGQYFAKSGFAGCNNEAQGVVLAWECAAKRKSPSDILAENHIANGRLSRKALAIAAKFQEAGGKIKWLKTGEDGKAAECQYTIEGETVTAKFTIEDAQKQGLTTGANKHNWTTRPGNMLRARCHTLGIGMLRPALVLGIETEEPDLGDIPSKELLPSKPAPTTTAPKQATVTEVRTVATAPAAPATEVSEPPHTATAEVAPTVANVLDLPAQTTPPAKPGVSNWNNPRDPKKVSAEGAAAIGDLIPADRQKDALKWMEEKQWIPPMGSLLDLTPNRAKLIYEQPEAFLKKITATA